MKNFLKALHSLSNPIANEPQQRSITTPTSAVTSIRRAVLVCFNIAVCCLSLVYVLRFSFPVFFRDSPYAILYDPDRLHSAVLTVLAFAIVSIIFVFAEFSFGYFVGFYFYLMIVSYIWLNCFSNAVYDHFQAGTSAAISAIAFLLPALLIRAPIRRVFMLSERMLEYVLMVILFSAAIIIAIGGMYHFQIVALEDIYNYRNQLQFPKALNYLIGMTLGALLPFAFAFCVTRQHLWRAAAALVLLLLLYPITLNKLALFAPVWLIAMAILSRIVEARTAVLLSLLLPLLVGISGIFFKAEIPVSLFRVSVSYFGLVNFRMVAIPATAMDVYNDFFSKHELTYFCQISILKAFVSCAYHDPLSVVMENAYKLGNFNASLFATEGVASVGVLFAPISAFVCGLIIALGNRLSAGLPPALILISSAILVQVMLNTPLSTSLQTNGAGLLFLLWYITPSQTLGDEQTDAKAGFSKYPRIGSPV